MKNKQSQHARRVAKQKSAQLPAKMSMWQLFGRAAAICTVMVSLIFIYDRFFRHPIENNEYRAQLELRFNSISNQIKSLKSNAHDQLLSQKQELQAIIDDFQIQSKKFREEKEEYKHQLNELSNTKRLVERQIANSARAKLNLDRSILIRLSPGTFDKQTAQFVSEKIRASRQLLRSCEKFVGSTDSKIHRNFFAAFHIYASCIQAPQKHREELLEAKEHLIDALDALSKKTGAENRRLVAHIQFMIGTISLKLGGHNQLLEAKNRFSLACRLNGGHRKYLVNSAMTECRLAGLEPEDRLKKEMLKIASNQFDRALKIPTENVVEQLRDENNFCELLLSISELTTDQADSLDHIQKAIAVLKESRLKSEIVPEVSITFAESVSMQSNTVWRSLSKAEQTKCVAQVAESVQLAAKSGFFKHIKTRNELIKRYPRLKSDATQEILDSIWAAINSTQQYIPSAKHPVQKDWTIL